MTEHDPLAAWRRNPFFVLEVATDAPPAEVERAGQRLLALLAVGSESAASYPTPLGPGRRDGDLVRQALAALRDPGERVLHELWADVAYSPDGPSRDVSVRDLNEGPTDLASASIAAEPIVAEPWDAAASAIGWNATWARS